VLAGVHLDAYKMASGVFRRGDLYSSSDATMLFTATARRRRSA